MKNIELIFNFQNSFQFVLLGNNILDLCTKLFPLCMKYNFGEIVSGMFNKDGIKSLAQMMNEVDSSADELSVKEDIGFYFKSYLVMLYSYKVLDPDKLVSSCINIFQATLLVVCSNI